jgi:hypothetical protein
VQPEDPEAGHALAGAGLTDDTERLAPLNRERQAIDSLDQPVVGREVDVQVLDVDERRRLSGDRLDVRRRRLGLARGS